MKKLCAILAAGLFVVVISTPVAADVIPGLGSNEGHLKDLSHHFDQAGNPAPVPGGLPSVGDELRSIYRLDDLEIIGGGKYWFHQTTTGDEVTGLLYDLKVNRLVDLDSDGVTDIIYYAPAGRNPLKQIDDRDGDIANFVGGWGGVVELYGDATPDLDATLIGGAGPGLWAAGGGPLRPDGVTQADGYVSASDGNLWLSGVLLDLSVFGDANAIAGEVYRLTRTGANDFAGIGFLNVFDGLAAPYIAAGTQPAGGPGAGLADVSLAFTVTLGTNVWGNPNWEAGSSDPVRFGVVPEPVTLLTVGMGAMLLGALRRRKK